MRSLGCTAGTASLQQEWKADGVTLLETEFQWNTWPSHVARTKRNANVLTSMLPLQSYIRGCDGPTLPMDHSLSWLPYSKSQNRNKGLWNCLVVLILRLTREKPIPLFWTELEASLIKILILTKMDFGQDHSLECFYNTCCWGL